MSNELIIIKKKKNAYITINRRMLNVMVIVVGNEISDPNSNSGRGFFVFYFMLRKGLTPFVLQHIYG